METLRKLLNAECGYRMRDETMNMFLGLMTEVRLKRHQVLVPYGHVDDNLYIVKTGIVREVHFDGFKEVTFSFSLPGTLRISFPGFLAGELAFSKYQACCESVVMKITKAQFTDLMKQSHDFAQWMTYMSLGQLLFYEKKRAIVNGDAKERYEALMENRPEIIRDVSSRIIASYIGVTPEYLCSLKRHFSKKSKKE